MAVKALKEDSLPGHRVDFAKEVRYAARLRHPNVIELIGVYSVNGEPTAAVFEYMIHGNLHEFLRLRAPANAFINEVTAKERIASDHDDFLHIATQVIFRSKSTSLFANFCALYKRRKFVAWFYGCEIIVMNEGRGMLNSNPTTTTSSTLPHR